MILSFGCDIWAGGPWWGAWAGMRAARVAARIPLGLPAYSPREAAYVRSAQLPHSPSHPSLP
nr:hypothetical protein KPHV_85950 [Kitasatospora purpeofusca]